MHHCGADELAHMEMISAIIYQLTRNLSEADIKKYGFDKYFVDHTGAIYPASASGVPFTAAYFQSKGDAFADLTEDLAAEQKARATYDNILRLADDPDVIDPIRYLREREVVHFQRFGEANRTPLNKNRSKFAAIFLRKCRYFYFWRKIRMRRGYRHTRMQNIHNCLYLYNCFHDQALHIPCRSHSSR